MPNEDKPYLSSRLYKRLRNELRRVAADPVQVAALRELLNGKAGDNPEGLLPSTKMKSWLLGKNQDRLPKVAVEGAAMGLRICLEQLGFPADYVPRGFLDGPEDAPAESSPAFDEGIEVPEELSRNHFDALKTTWLYGDYAIHAVRIAEPSSDSDRLDAKIWRFFSGLRMVPPEFEPLSEGKTTHLVHGSTLDFPDAIEGKPESFGLEERDGEVITDPSSVSRQVHFLVTLAHGEPPLTCGYSIGLKQRFLRHEAADQRYDAFSGANAVVLRQGVVVASLPVSQFDGLDSADGVLFATPTPMLPRMYVEKVADKAKRHVLGKRHGLYSTWAKPAEESRRVESSEALWEFASIGTRESFINTSISSLFGPDRVVFASRFNVPNPLAYQSLMWKLPEKC